MIIPQTVKSKILDLLWERKRERERECVYLRSPPSFLRASSYVSVNISFRF